MFVLEKVDCRGQLNTLSQKTPSNGALKAVFLYWKLGNYQFILL